MISSRNQLVMGWLAKVPRPEECLTGHKYQRSPCSTEECPMYIGGPVSLANFDEVDRVEFRRCVSEKEPFRNKIYIRKATGRKIVAGHEILWSYSLLFIDRQLPKFYKDNVWQLACCSQVMDMSAAITSTSQASVNDAPPAKKRKVGGQRPLMSTGECTSHKWCTYCGINLLNEVDGGKKILNFKRHLALKHAAHLSSEMRTDVNSEDDVVCDKAFIKHLDIVDHIYNSLKSHGYKLIPACNYFELNNTEMLPEEANPEEKARVFQEFSNEAKTAFSKYQVVYLRGIVIPEKYEDLMKMEPNSNYTDVNWQQKRPSGVNFSLNSYKLSAEEESEHALHVKQKFTSIVVGWLAEPN